MKYEKETVVVIISLLLFVIIGIFGRLNITGFTTSSPELAINLSKTNYTSNEIIQGSLKINLNSPLDKNVKLKVSINSNSLEYLFTDLLNKSKIKYSFSESSQIASDQNTTKTIIFSEPSSQKLGLEIPANSTVTGIDMKIESSEKNSSFPTFPYIDVSSDDNIEWNYFGNLIDYVNETIPSSLDLTKEEQEYINNNNTLYCNVLDLPYSRNFNFSVMYAKQEDGGNIKLLVMSCESCSGSSFTAYGGLDTCDLPESTTKDWHSCTLSFQDLSGKPIPSKGKYLVCAYSSLMPAQSATFYKISVDKNPTDIAYTCDASTLSDGKVVCNKKTYRNYYIKFSVGNYSKVLNTAINFADWLTSFPFAASITNYLKTCKAQGYYCVVPLKVSSDSPGILKLSQLSLDFKTPDGTSSGTNQFTDIITQEGKLNKINNIDLTAYKTNITISLSLLNITVPKPELSDIYTLVISLASSSDNKFVTVIPTSTPEDISTLEYEISNSNKNLKSLLTDQKTQELIDYMNIKDRLTSISSTLNSYEAELITIKTSNLTTEEKQEKISLISSNYDNLKKEIIEINPKEEVTSTLKIELSDIKDEILAQDQKASKEEIFSLQDNFIITSTIKQFQVIKDNKIEEKTIIKKNIKASVPSSDVYVVEEIPKQIASRLSNIEFKNKDYEIIQDDPIIRFYYRTLNTAEISYLINRYISSTPEETKTIIIPKSAAKEQQLWSCGDGKCTIPYEDKVVCPEDCKGKAPYTQIAIIIIVTFLAVIILNLSKKIKFSKKVIIDKKDFEKLKAFIQSSLKQGLKKEQIIKLLLDRGWKQEQVDYVFKRVKK